MDAAAAAARRTLGVDAPLEQLREVRMLVGAPCSASISFWPKFRFSAPTREPQAGSVRVMPAPCSSAAAESDSGSGAPEARQQLHVNFTRDPPDEFSLGLRLAHVLPFPRIVVRTDRLEGTVCLDTGAVDMVFEAAFVVQVGRRARTSLDIRARLTSEATSAYGTELAGKRLVGGRCTLVSAAEVPKTASRLANLLLWLPAAATAVLPARLEFR